VTADRSFEVVALRAGAGVLVVLALALLGRAAYLTWLSPAAEKPVGVLLVMAAVACVLSGLAVNASRAIGRS
jgi:hypothetical protein